MIKKIKRKRLADGSDLEVTEEVKATVKGSKDINKNQKDVAKKFKKKDLLREYLPEYKENAPDMSEPTSRLIQGKPKLAKKGLR